MLLHSGRRGEATQMFERLLQLQNDVGLLAEEYDPHARRQLGNFPQALSHLSLVTTAVNLAVRNLPNSAPLPVFLCRQNGQRDTMSTRRSSAQLASFVPLASSSPRELVAIRSLGTPLMVRKVLIVSARLPPRTML